MPLESLPATDLSPVRRLKWLTYTVVACWTILAIGSLYYQLERLRSEAISFARATARYSIKKDMLYWRLLPQANVYMPVGDWVQPEPLLAHLPERDVTTPSGRVLTLVNPASIIKQSLGLGRITGDAWGHLTSLKPLQAGNEPDEWEANALRTIKTTGKQLYYAPALIDGRPFMRYMYGIEAGQTCQACHASQGYGEHEFCGGISTSIPLDTYESRVRRELPPAMVIHVLLWGVGTVTMLVGGRRLQRHFGGLIAAEARVRDNEARFRLAMDAADEGFIDWQIPANWVYRSPSCYTMLGYQPGEIDQTIEAWGELVHPDDRAASQDILDRVREGRIGSFQLDYRLRTRDNEYRWFQARGKVVEHDDKGRPVRLMGTHVDVTNRKLAQHELERHRNHLEELVQERTRELDQSREQLQRAERLASIGTLAAGMAHEINNPLAMILLGTERALRALDKPDTVEGLLQQNKRDVERCARIVRGMLDFARHRSTQKWPLDLNEIVRHSMDFTLEFARQNGVAITARLDDELPRLMGNATELEQVVVNLVHNAVYACGDGGRVTIETRQAKGMVQLVVSDDGCGMNPQQLEHVFDPFYTTRMERGGTGLGLSTVHGIVTSHGAAIRVASLPGNGTVFTIEFQKHVETEVDDGQGAGS